MYSSCKICTYVLNGFIFLLCKTVEHMAVVHKFFTLRSLDAFYSNLGLVMKQ